MRSSPHTARDAVHGHEGVGCDSVRSVLRSRSPSSSPPARRGAPSDRRSVRPTRQTQRRGPRPRPRQTARPQLHPLSSTGRGSGSPSTTPRRRRQDRARPIHPSCVGVDLQRRTDDDSARVVERAVGSLSDNVHHNGNVHGNGQAGAVGDVRCAPHRLAIPRAASLSARASSGLPVAITSVGSCAAVAGGPRDVRGRRQSGLPAYGITAGDEHWQAARAVERRGSDPRAAASISGSSTRRVPRHGNVRGRGSVREPPG